MGDSHSGCDASGLPAAELLRAALECETEGPWIERRLRDGTLDERLRESVREAALAAFDTPGIEALLSDALALEAAAHPDAEAELAPWQRDAAIAAFEEADALDDVLADALALESAARAPEALPEAVTQAAHASLDRASPAEAAEGGRARVLSFPARTTRAEPLRARRMRAPLLLRPAYAAAAVLLVALGLGLLLFGSGEEAQAGLQLRALSHRNLESRMGLSQVEPRYFAALGRVFAPGDSELLSLGLAAEGLVVVGEGDAVRVARPGTLPADLAAPLDAVLRLESGEARLATRDEPIPLEVDGVGLFVLEEGAAHVALQAEAAGGAPAVALAEHSVARFHRADGTSVPLAGPTHVALEADGVKSFGAPARSLFRELAFFGGPLPTTTQVRTVRARLFDIRAGLASRGRQDVRVLETAAAAPSSARLAWRPEAVLYDAQRLRVALRAPRGTTVSLAQEGAASVQAEVTRESVGSEPGLATVELALPADWFERLPGGRLELTIRVPARESAAGGNAVTGAPTASAPSAKAKKRSARRRKPVRAWFDGVSLVLGPTEDGLPPKFLRDSMRRAKSVLQTKAER